MSRWDGRVFFLLPGGEEISRLARLVHLVHVAQVFHRLGGQAMADDVVRARRAGEFDPQLSDLWLANSSELLRPLGRESLWETALAAEPEPHRLVPRSHIDKVASAFADFVDLKASHTVGHSAAVARLAGTAAAALGLDEAGRTELGWAAQVHDLGCVSVPNRIWNKRGSLTRAEWERVRLHAYHSQRVVAVAEPLRKAGELAAMHHERTDGSGYHRGLPAAAIPLEARVLAAAEAYQSMVEERPWRPALAAAETARELIRDADAGRLERRAVDAVLEAAGGPRQGRRGSSWPAGLTDREIDVLRRLARGRSNGEIARELHVSEGTVHTHVIHIYGKIEVNTRAGAANPFHWGGAEPGETVVDLGSGGGMDSLLAALWAGPSGRVIGIDMTPEMVERSRRSADELGIENVEFRVGYMEEVPVEDGCADRVISNGAINLCADKLAVYREIHRILKPGGRMTIADLCVEKPVPESALRDIDLWTG